jgi:eukaryotic-like serine/threonine-protein kinase
MALAAGTKLGPYELLAPVGEGGMGEVWKARDTRLNRVVAIKQSRDRFSDRFAREALAIAALNHPHICSIYDVGPDYLVMEFVDGKPLQGPITLDAALETASEILDALDAAHRQGIVHRDLKPGNILVGKNGVKVLDFGLAKMGAQAGTEATMTIPLTGEGSILGTLQYMAPEQLEGKEADARSDIFAFGLILYELITGKRAFTATSQASLIASILKEQPPPIHDLQPLTPAALERVVQTCLEKDPEKRWQSAREIKHALAWIADLAPAAPAATTPAPPSRIGWIVWAVAGLMAAALATLSLVHFREKPPVAPQPYRFQIATPDLPNDVNFYMPLSPDGRELAYTAAGSDGVRRLWVRDMGTLESRMLAGTDNAVSPFWSPDSQYIGFAVGNTLNKVEASGASPPVTLCQMASAVGSGAWNEDGVIIFGGRPRGPLHRVSSSGGTPVEITAVSNDFHTFPVFLPDRRHFIYLRVGNPETAGIYAGSLDTKPSQQSTKRLLASPVGADFVPTVEPGGGRLLFWRDGTLMAQPFDTTRLELTGEPVPIAEHVGAVNSGAWFSASSNGVLAYRTGGAAVANGGRPDTQLTWYDRKGNMLSRVGEFAPHLDLALSPDGARLATFHANGQQDIWLLEFARNVSTRFTFSPAADQYPVWSPDGTKIAFSSARSGHSDLYVKAANGASDEQVLLKSPDSKIPTSWSRDGRFLLYMSLGAKGKWELWALPMEGSSHKPVPLLQTQFNELLGAFSPDGKWIAYLSDESGRQEVYVRPFNASGPSGAPVLGDGKWQVSTDGANSFTPTWREDSKELLFYSGLNVIAVEVSTAPTFRPDNPQVLFRFPLADGGAITPDGKRFLLSVVAAPDAGKPQPITVVLNWPALLKR